MESEKTKRINIKSKDTKVYKTIVLIFIVFSVNIYTHAQKFFFEFNSGWSGNVLTPLIIKQDGYSDLSINAQYYSEPFRSPIYWLWRFYYSSDTTSGWMFEAVHHKLYLKNCPPEVDYFSISHGLNLLFVNKIFYYKKHWHFNTGIGTVLAHPENKIRGKVLNKSGIFGMGYFFSGIAGNISAGYRLHTKRMFHFNIEGRLNISYSIVPVYMGKAYVPNISPQIIFGIGHCIFNKDKHPKKPV